MSIQAIRILNPWFLELDTRGRPAAGYRVYTLQAGSTSTLIDTYVDKDLLVKNTNPIVLNSRGECTIFTEQPSVKLVYTTPDGDLGSPIWTQDYVIGSEQFDLWNTGSASGTTNNVYVVTTSPVYTSIPDGFSLVMIPDVNNLDTLILRAFTGVGINDAFFKGPYSGSTPSTFQVEIDGTGTPDTFRWRKDSGSWISGVAITGSWQNLQEGVAVKFGASIGHTANDLWTQTVRPPAYLDFCSLGNKIIYKSADGALQPLDGDDIIAGIPAHMDYSTSENCWILLNPTTPVFSDQIQTRERKEIASTYTVDVEDDWGKELSCKGTFTVTLPPCTNAANRFYYIVNAGTGIITVEVDGGTDLIILPGFTSGVTDFELLQSGWTSVQLVTNGVDWHILAAVGELHGIETFTSSGTWTRPANVQFVNVMCVGGGGGGGGVSSSSGNGGSGGGGGEFTHRFHIDVSADATVSVTRGSGGNGSTGGDGGSGGASSFGSYLSANGGGGGKNGASSPTTGGTGGYGNAANKTYAVHGDNGGNGNGSSTVDGGSGGKSGGGRGNGTSTQTSSNSNGYSGNPYGGGGSGASAGSNARSGGQGSAGIVVVWW